MRQKGNAYVMCVCAMLCNNSIVYASFCVCEQTPKSEKQIYDKFSLPYFITFIFMQKN